MKKHMVIVMVLAGLGLNGCAHTEMSNGIKVVSEKPFAAAPTNQMIYDDCKRAIELYEKKDPRYATTMCIAEIRANFSLWTFLSTLDLIEQRQSLIDCNKELLKKLKKKSGKKEFDNTMNFDKVSPEMFYAKLIVDMYKNPNIYRTKPIMKLTSTHGAIGMFYDSHFSCNAIHKINPLKDLK